jgi:SAM-dependent methyltransferase
MFAALTLLKTIVPKPTRTWLRQQQHRLRFSPPLGWARFGSLWRLKPICDDFGFSRGKPVDRYYIEKFLNEQAADIKGRVLEVADNYYTLKFGGDKVTRSDVLHVDSTNPVATIVADLACVDNLPADTFDCIICTQTLPCIYDVKAAVQNLYRMLKPDGVLLTPNPGIGQISKSDWKEGWGVYWRFSAKSIERLLEEVFARENVKLDVYGNVLAATAFLQGIAWDELRPEELDYRDPMYQYRLLRGPLKRFRVAFS